MKHLPALLLALAAPFAARAQAPAWQTLTGLPQPAGNTAQIKATAVDSTGAVLVAGAFTGAATFGGTTLTSAGSYDGFVAKWNPAAAAWTWAYALGGGGYDELTALAVQGTRVYVAGDFGSDTCRLGAVKLPNSGIARAPGNYPNDVVVARFTDAGPAAALAWARQSQGDYEESVAALVVAGRQVYVAGTLIGTVSPIGPVPGQCNGCPNNVALGPVLLPARFGPLADGFVAKLTDTGPGTDWQWGLRLGDLDTDLLTALAVAGSNVYVGGGFSLAGAGTPPPPALPYTVAKITDSGSAATLRWASNLGQLATALAVTGPDVYAAGVFQGTTAFGATSLSSQGSTDVFVSHLADAGATAALAGTAQLGGPGPDNATALAATGPALLLAGGFQGATFAAGATVLAGAGTAAAPVATGYVARLLAAAVPRVAWATSAGGASATQPAALALAGNRIWVGGSAAPRAAFGPLRLPAGVGTPAGFLASLEDLTLARRAPAADPAALALYPNPAHETLALTGLPDPAAPLTATLCNALGQAVRAVVLAPVGGAVALSVAGVPPGVYALQLRGGGLAATCRVVVE